MEQGGVASALRFLSVPSNIDKDGIIDIHDISVILNYERGVIEPRFRHAKLREVATNQEFRTALVMAPEWKEANPNHRTGMLFEIKEDCQTDEPDLPSNMMHRNPTPSVRKLTRKQLETYYWQARNHDGCFRTVTLLQHFFNLFPFNTPIRIRTHASVSGRHEGDKPAKQKTIEYITTPSRRKIVEFHITNSKHVSASIITQGTGYFTGGSWTPHAVIGFSQPGQQIDTILDLSSLQYGEVGRGYKDADCFVFEPIQDYVSLTLPKYGESNTIKTAKLSDFIGPAPDDVEEYLIEVAQRAKKRWENRKEVPFCAYCGAPPAEGRQLSRCSGCKVEFYCGSEHQRNAWPLHKLFCRPTTTNPR